MAGLPAVDQRASKGRSTPRERLLPRPSRQGSGVLPTLLAERYRAGQIRRYLLPSVPGDRTTPAPR
jgi:hypothetical protein